MQKDNYVPVKAEFDQSTLSPYSRPLNGTCAIAREHAGTHPANVTCANDHARE